MTGLWEAVTASAVPVVIGGATERLHLFLEPLQSVRDRVKLQRKALIERLASKHADLLRDVQADMEVSRDVLRDFVVAPRGSDEDKIGAFTFETFRLFAICYRLEALGWIVRTGHLILLCSTILGLIGLILSFLVPDARSIVLATGLSIGGAQALIVLAIFLCARKLDDYEEIT